jgi:hypothetical protein
VLASTSHQASARVQLAHALPGQVRVGLTRSEPVPRLSSGVARLDALLGGGLPRGRISELCGSRSSGKTSLLLSLLAAATRRGEVVACVDLPDALHPESIALAGADLRRLLWVRPGSVTDALRCTELLLQAGGFAVIVLDLGDPVPRPLRTFVWPRLLRAAEQSHAAFVVSAPQRIAGSSAVLSLGFRRRASRWRHGAWPLFDGFDIVAEVERTKLGPSEAKSIKLKVQSQKSGLSAFNFSL